MWAKIGANKANFFAYSIFPSFFIKIIDNITFQNQFKVQVPEGIKSDMDYVRRLESDMGFMGSPSYEEAKNRISNWHNSN